jgi:hypothetical protein
MNGEFHFSGFRHGRLWKNFNTTPLRKSFESGVKSSDKKNSMTAQKKKLVC